MLRLYPYIGLIFLLFLSTVQAQDSCTDKIAELFSEGKYGKCVQLADECNWTDSALLLPLIGQAAYHTQQYRTAKDKLLHSLDYGDSSLEVLKSLARIFEQEWNFPKAIKYYRLFLEQDSSQAGEWYRLGLISLKAKLLPDAFRALAKAIKINPQHFQARVKIADILIQQKEYEDAAAFIKDGLKQDSTNVLLLLQAGRSWYYADSFRRSVQVYKKAEKQIDLPVKHSRIKGIAHYKLNEFEKGLNYLKDALVGTDKDYIHYYLGMSYLGLEDTASAADQFDLAIEESYATQIPMYCDYRASLHEQAGNWKSAIILYKEAYRRSADPKFLVRLANAYDRWYDDKSIAIRYLNRYLASGDKQYLGYAEERLRILKGYEHMK
jgi:tetratricopeptide (TPR) repeat protein